MNNLSGKKLLLLGGVQPMCQVVNEAHKLGVEVYVTDYLKDSPAKKIADKSFMVSTTDIDGVVELCRREKIDGVFTGYTDSMLPYCKKICEQLKFPFWGDDENIKNCIDKMKFKVACENAGVPVVPWMIANEKNYREIADKIQFPVVIKPVDNSGSRGVFKCYASKDFSSLCEKALEFSKCKEIMIEKMMDAENEFSVYYMLYKGKVYLTEMGDRYVYAPDPQMAPLGQGMNYPSMHLEAWRDNMEPCMQKFFEMNRMKDGFCFFQGFYDKGQFFIHEVGYRLCGGFAYKYVDELSGYNQVQQMIKYALTGTMDIKELEKSDARFPKNAFTLTVALHPGKIGMIKGVNEIKKISGILEVCQLHYVGDEINLHGATARVFAYILCVVNNKEELFEIIKKVEDLLKVYDNEGENMLVDLVCPDKISLYYE